MACVDAPRLHPPHLHAYKHHGQIYAFRIILVPDYPQLYVFLSVLCAASYTLSVLTFVCFFISN